MKKQAVKKWLARSWWGAGIALLVARVLTGWLAPGAAGATPLTVLLILWAIPSSVLLLVRAWRRLTYRIGVRLFLSYLLIGVMPFPLMLAALGLGGYLLAGQYTSVRYAELLRGTRAELERLAEVALLTGQFSGADAGAAVLAAGPRLHPDVLSPVEWLYSDSGGVRRSDGAATLEPPSWAPEGRRAGPFLTPDGPVLAAVQRRGERLAVAFVPLDDETARRLGEGRWFEASFSVGRVTSSETSLTIDTAPEARGSGEEAEEEAGGEPETEDEGAAAAEPAPAEAEETAASTEVTEADPGLWHRRWIVFFRLGAELADWQGGTPVPDLAILTVLRTSPAEAFEDLFRSPYRLGIRFFVAFAVVCAFFLAVYLGVVAVAAIQIFSITRAAARLTRGTRQVEAGALDYRIPVRRRDQLGDLASSFNRMTESVQGMLDEVREKERLKRELELAREIQQSLLPDRRLRHGSLEVHAVFRPAAEVGGDYFDLFPLEGGRLLVAIGDVAGHGLSTGLLMAMVKSAVATLIGDGHRGPALFQRLNQLMREQPREHRMLTLALVEIDPGARRAEITSAGHPGGFLLSPAGEVREVQLSGLPLGVRWDRPPAQGRLELPPGGRLLLYSDGLVEARDAADEAFGYERLRRLLTRLATLPPEELLARLLAALEEHTGARPADDDLTLLLVELATDPDSGPSESLAS